MPKYGHDIRIREVLNGFIVKVGCEYVVIEGGDNIGDAANQLCDLLRQYLMDREGVHKAWYEMYRPHIPCGVPQPTVEYNNIRQGTGGAAVNPDDGGGFDLP